MCPVTAANAQRNSRKRNGENKGLYFRFLKCTSSVASLLFSEDRGNTALQFIVIAFKDYIQHCGGEVIDSISRC